MTICDYHHDPFGGCEGVYDASGVCDQCGRPPVTSKWDTAARILPGTLDIEAAISEIVEANTAPGSNFAPTLASSLHSFLLQWVTTELDAHVSRKQRSDWSDVNPCVRRVWIVREGVWAMRVPLTPYEYAALLDEIAELRSGSVSATVQLPKQWQWLHKDGCPRQGKVTMDATICTCDPATRAAINTAAAAASQAPPDFGPVEVVVNGTTYVREETLFAAMRELDDLREANRLRDSQRCKADPKEYQVGDPYP